MTYIVFKLGLVINYLAFMKYQMSGETKGSSSANVSLYYWMVRHDSIKTNKLRLRHGGSLLKINKIRMNAFELYTIISTVSLLVFASISL